MSRDSLREPTTPLGDMDWSAVALLLAERAGFPVALLDAEGRILFVAPAAQRLLGWRSDSVGQSWEGFVAVEALSTARWLISKALSGATHHFEIALVTPGGRALVSFESYPVGRDEGRGVLLFVEKLDALAVPPFGHDCDYEVEGVKSGAFRLLALRAPGAEPTRHSGSCFEVLHGQNAPCDECPIQLLQGIGDVRSVVRKCEPAELEVKTVRLIDSDRAHVSVRRLAASTFPAMLKARLDELAQRAQLSPRERDVLAQLIDGRTFEEIGEALGITPRTVKYHQAKLLAKLGADSRHDLIRLIF